MEPEIARRCKSCGAAIRARSAFCPQCGVAQAEESAAGATASAPVAAPETSQRRMKDSGPGAETIAPLPETIAPVKTETPLKTEMPAAAATAVTGKDAASPVSSAENLPRAVVPDAASPEAVIEKMQRVSTATTTARNVADDGVRQRGDKLRRASNVVLDEAAADPSLRFVLVATALIIISLLLLLLARVL